MDKMMRRIWQTATFFVATVVALGMVGCGGCSGDDPATSNCGRFTDDNWVAPQGCDCKGPHGERTFVPEGLDEEESITCNDPRLQKCPSTSGVGCELPFRDQAPVTADDPAMVHLHVDIGGHMHDVCCSQHYNQEGGVGFALRCNGCGGGSPDGVVEICENTTFVGATLDKPQNPDYACAAEWQYAVQAYAGPDVYWWTQVDTSLRWTPGQTVERNLGGSPPPYTRPDAENRPLFGRALAPNPIEPNDQRARSGQLLGTVLLSDPYDPVTGALGMNAEQIGSFCKSEVAVFDDVQNGWVCE